MIYEMLTSLVVAGSELPGWGQPGHRNHEQGFTGHEPERVKKLAEPGNVITCITGVLSFDVEVIQFYE